MAVELGVELWGKVFEEYVTVGLCVELCWQVFEEYVTVEFGGELCGKGFGGKRSRGVLVGERIDSWKGLIRGRDCFVERNIFVSSGDKRTLSWMSFGRDFPSTMSLDRLL